MRKKILILEDDKINQHLLGIYLKKDYETKIVGTVAEAMDEVLNSSYDLIISDLNLGNNADGDGSDFLKFVQSNKHLKHIPVAVYSGYEHPDKSKGIKLSAYISKPISKSDFLNTVSNILFPEQQIG